MIADLWFWAFWGLFIGCLISWIYSVWKDQRDWQEMGERWAKIKPQVTEDTMTITHLRLALRRTLIILSEIHWRDGRVVYPDMAQRSIREAEDLLRGTEFEIQ